MSASQSPSTRYANVVTQESRDTQNSQASIFDSASTGDEDSNVIFHAAVDDWFAESIGKPTRCQERAWPSIQRGSNTLIAAPTGSGKTLAAFLAVIDRLVRQGLNTGQLPEKTQVVYVSPLKALSNDIEKNLRQPVQGIRDSLRARNLPEVDIRVAVRSGDTPPAERARMRRRPPHILVTTPESLYILLTSESGRRMLSSTATVIIDEIHALAPNKRGSHLALSLERLCSLTETPPVRIGLSATQAPIERVAQYLVGASTADCQIIDEGHHKERDIDIEMPDSPLEAVMATEVWAEIYDRLAEHARARNTTLIFVNTRRLAERVARALAERLGEEAVTSHHGSLSRKHRLNAETRLKNGELTALVATASLELGIDIGDVDLVCQIGSPAAISTFLQRVGRSGHAVGATPTGRLFPTTRDDLVQCVALLDSVRRGELDRLHVPECHLDVLTQHIVAEVAGQEWQLDALYALVCRADQYAALPRQTFDQLIAMLGEGFSTRRGRRGAYLHVDAVNGRVRARRGARLTAVTNGGAIPDQFDYDVVLEPEGISIGTLNEDFAFESLPGDIFQLGNTSYRVLQVERSKVRVEDARGQPPNIPFWFGEAPGRSVELSESVSRLRTQLDLILDDPAVAEAWLRNEVGVCDAAASQLTSYMATTRAALGVLPSQKVIVLERFFDDAGDMHLVIHSSFGSRVNRAWGLALRKKFCRHFNFELQAAALEDSIVLSLGATHSFAITDVINYLNPNTVQDVLVQALLDAPMFEARWRWVANIALAVKRFRGGRKVPAPIQRSDAEDLIALVFPDQIACLENIAGDREVPDHPLVAQTLYDCLHEVMDIDGLKVLLKAIEANSIQIIGMDLTEPSPLAQEILTARPYAFLDDAPAEERRTRAVQTRRYTDVQSASQLGRLDPAAVERVLEQAWPSPASADELHDALVTSGWLLQSEILRYEQGSRWFEELAAQQRASCLTTAQGVCMVVAAERLAQIQAVFAAAQLMPSIQAVSLYGRQTWTREDALVEIVRGRLEIAGPLTATAIRDLLKLDVADIDYALARLESEGFAIRGHFYSKSSTNQSVSVSSIAPADPQPVQWCDRRLLARIHQATLEKLRREIEPVSLADYMRFLFDWQGLFRPANGVQGLRTVLERLTAFEAPLTAWENDLLPRRVRDFSSQMLESLCLSGEWLWWRNPPAAAVDGSRRTRPRPVSATPVSLLPRASRKIWQRGAGPDLREDLSENAQRVVAVLMSRGALFADELSECTDLCVADLRKVLAELTWYGLVSSDGIAGLRQLSRHRRVDQTAELSPAGRWSVIPENSLDATDDAVTEDVIWALLRRYGVVCRSVLAREPGVVPPWRLLVPMFRRLEAQGRIRGGRFISGPTGEQFALAEAVDLLRKVRRTGKTGRCVVIGANDPCNLVGTLLPGKRITAVPSNRIIFRDGVCAGVQTGRQVEWLIDLTAEDSWAMRQQLAMGVDVDGLLRKRRNVPPGVNAPEHRQPGPDVLDH